MTREEIIRNLEYTMEKHKNDTVSTFDTNISAMCKDILDYLKQEPCEDAISRNMALSEVKSGMIRTIDGENWKRVNDNVRDILALPSVTPRQRA